METGTSQLERHQGHRGLVVLVLVLLAAMAVAAFSAFRHSIVYDFTPTQVLSKQGQDVRVEGTVVPGSVHFAPQHNEVTFKLTDSRSTVPVDFVGAVPDTLKGNGQAIAQGTLRTSGVFQAVNVTAKCPSKFQTKQAAAG